MGTVVADPDLLNQLNAADPNSAGTTAPPLTITPGTPVSDPDLIKTLNAAPDDPTPAAPPQPSTWKDMVRSAGSGLVKGSAAAVGMAGDAANFLGEKLPAYAIAYGAQGLGLLPEGKTASDFINDVTSNPQLNTAPTGGLSSVANATSLPTGQSTLNAIQTVAGQKLPAPQTSAGQMTENVASFIPQSIFGGSSVGALARNVGAYGVAPGVASEVAGQSANSMLGSWADAPARFIGGALGGGVGHLGIAPAPADHILSGATRGVSDADMANAQALQQRSAGLGINITPAEAVQQVTGGASNLGAVQRNLEGMSESAPIMKSYFAQRPQQVQDAASDVFGQIAPYPSSPSAIGVAAQAEGQGAMSAIKGDRSNVTAPYYQAAQSDQVPQSRMAQVASQIDGLISDPSNPPSLTGPLQTLRQQIVETPATATTPEIYRTNVGALDKIYGATRDAYGGPAPVGQSGTDARASYLTIQGNNALNEALLDSSPNLAAGRQAHAFMTQRYVAPREAGPIGQVSQTNDLGAQGQALYPSNPNVGSQFETQEAVQRLPNTAGPITRNYLEKAFNEATQNNMTGPNQWGGAKFAAGAFGNTQQAQNLYAGLGALPNGAQVTPRVQALADALSATGQRQPMGSQTAYNEQFKDHMETGTPLGTAASLVASPIKAAEYARDWYMQRRVGTNAEALANALIGPDGFDRLAAARTAVPPEQYRALVAQLLLGRSSIPAVVGAQNQSGQ